MGEGKSHQQLGGGRLGIGITIALCAVLSGSPAFLLPRILSARSDGMSQLAARSPFFLASISLLHVIACGGRPAAAVRSVRAGCVSLGWKLPFLSLLLAGQSAAILFATLLTSVANVTIIINAAPGICALLDIICLKEKLGMPTFIMIVCGMAASFLIVGFDFANSPSNTVGNIVAFANPIAWGLYWSILRMREKSRAETMATACNAGRKDELAAVQLGAGFFCLIAGFACGADFSKPALIDWLLWFPLYGGVVLPLAVHGFSIAPSFLKTSTLAIIKQIEIPLATIYAWLYSNEIPSTVAVVACLALVSGVALHSFFDLRAERAREKKHIESHRERVAQWMGKMPDETSLCDIVLPGTHNSCTHAAGSCALACVWPFARCQFFSIKEQLDCGIRAFDLRVRWYKGDIVISHTFNSSYTLASACREISNFLATAKTECIILFFKVDWPHRDAWSKEATDVLWGTLIDTLPIASTHDSHHGRKVFNSTLSQVRGSVIAVPRDDLTCHGNDSNFVSRMVHVESCSPWDLKGVLAAKAFILENLGQGGGCAARGFRELGLNVVVWFLCIPLPPVMVAQDMNQWTLTQLPRWKSSEKKLGIVCSDFASVEFLSALIAYNFEPDGTSEEVSLNID